MNVNDGTVPCPVCGDAIQGSTLRAVVPMRARITELEAEAVALKKTLNDALELAEEGWGYASDHFREKWGYKERITELRTRPLP